MNYTIIGIFVLVLVVLYMIIGKKEGFMIHQYYNPWWRSSFYWPYGNYRTRGYWMPHHYRSPRYHSRRFYRGRRMNKYGSNWYGIRSNTHSRNYW